MMERMVSDDIEIASPSYSKICKIGVGTFGKVYKCQNSVTQELFAVKEIKMTLPNLSTILSEMKIIKQMPPHERLVTFFGMRGSVNLFQIFTEFMSKGSLRDHIVKDGNLSEEKASQYVKSIVEGIDFLHENNIIHRDIKCGNVLLDDHENVKLTDFGLSKAVDNKSVMENHTFCGTLYFMAPEILLGGTYCSSVDIWALGVTVVEMLTGYPIYFNLKGGAFVEKIISAAPVDPGLPNHPSEKLLYFLKLTFMKQAASRPKAKDLLRTQFLLRVNS